MVNHVGVVLSGSTSTIVEFELTRQGEQLLREGMLVVIGDRLLARVESIRIYSGFYQAGDAWSNARREGYTPPNDLARYTVARAVVLGELSSNGITEATKPPFPGEPVTLFEQHNDLTKLYGVEPGAPGVIWYGSLLGYSDLPLALDVESFTMHIGVFGETGSGKSYGFGYLLELLSRIPIDEGVAALPAIVVDANGDYLDLWDSHSRGEPIGEYAIVQRLVAPTSKARHYPYTATYSVSLEGFTAREIAELILAYKTGAPDFNELQVAALERTLRIISDEHGIEPHKAVVDSPEALMDKLEELAQQRIVHHQTLRAVYTAIDKFHQDLVETYRIVTEAPSLRRENIDVLVKTPSLLIVDFSAEGAPGLPLTVKQLIVAYIARILYTQFTEYKMKGNEAYVLFAIEEAQNYAPNPRNYPISWSIARDYLSLIATQGRKFGICLAIISQRPSFVDPVVVSMLNTFFIHRLSPDDIAYISRAVGGLPPELERRLPRLPRGYVLVSGQANMLREPVIVRVGERRVSHRMGATRLRDYLRTVARKKRKN